MLILCFAILLVFSNKCVDQSLFRGIITINKKSHHIRVSFHKPEGSFWQVHHTRTGKELLVEWLPCHSDVEKALEEYEKMKELTEYRNSEWIHYLSDRQRNALDEIELSIPWDNTSLSYLIMLYLLVEDPKDISNIKSLYSISNENRLILKCIFDNPVMLYALNRARDRKFGVKKGKVLGLDRPETLVFFNNWSPWNESNV